MQTVDSGEHCACADEIAPIVFVPDNADGMAIDFNEACRQHTRSRFRRRGRADRLHHLAGQAIEGEECGERAARRLEKLLSRHVARLSSALRL